MSSSILSPLKLASIGEGGNNIPPLHPPHALPHSDTLKKKSRSRTMDIPVVASNTLLREDMAIQMIHENRMAIERCRAVAVPAKAPEWCMK